MSLNTFYQHVDDMQNMGYNVHFISFFNNTDLWDQVWSADFIHSFFVFFFFLEFILFARRALG
jgi:hypothetical protein